MSELEKKYRVSLTFDELSVLDGRCSADVQGIVDAAKSDTPEISVEKAVAIIAKHCAEIKCKHCPYAATVPGWDFYICMFQSITPCRWEPSKSADE